MPRYFEDLEVGIVRELGSATLTRDDVVAFGEQWDPLAQHVDPDAAPDSLAGGLVASGLHTVCLSNRLAAEGYRKELADVVGLGFDDLRFPAPVRPGDTVSVTHEVTGTRPSASNPDVGVVTTHISGETEAAGPVVEYTVNTLVGRRDADGPETTSDGHAASGDGT